MNRRAAILLSTYALLGFSFTASPAHSQKPALQARLIGTWSYVSSTARLPDGSPLSLADCVLLAAASGASLATADPPLARAARAERIEVHPLQDSRGRRP